MTNFAVLKHKSLLMKKLFSLASLAVLFTFVLSCSTNQEEIVEKYENGNPKTIYIYKTDKKQRIKTAEERLYENGKRRMYGKYDNDKRTGKWEFCFSNGELFARADFTNSPTGSGWEVYDTNGENLVTKDDKVLELHFAEDGGLCDIKIKKGEGEIFYKFFESFKPCIVSEMKGNIPNGKTTSWFENGQINSSYHYKDGIQDKEYKVYTEEGKTLIKGQYDMGTKVGKWEYFLSDGSPAGTEIYDVDGTLLKGRNE